MKSNTIFKNLQPTNCQEIAFEMLLDFINGDKNVFILKGYAGTGKTTLVKYLISYIKELGLEVDLMAPTGRAAKILRDKTGEGSTIHRVIYNFSSLESINKDSEDEADHSFHFYFPINTIDSAEQRLIIIDESSMVSNVESKNELFSFGTNYLLSDLLTYAAPQTTHNKLIFVGDPAQLEPFNDSQSYALQRDFFENRGLKVMETELREVKRQADNLILKNASTMRDVLENPDQYSLKLDFDQTSYIRLNPIEVITKYTDFYPKPEIGDGVVVAWTNGQCCNYNQAIREKLYPGQTSIVAGDLLLLGNNNYHTYKTELFNGDILKVVEVENTIITQSAPVYCDENGRKVKKIIELKFRKITIRIPNFDEDISCMIIDNHLHSIYRDLSYNETRAIYINFVMRFREEQKRREETGLPTFKVGSDEFKGALKSDPFFNALRVKFGYAITCHKAQGGEWKKVFVDYYGNVSMSKSSLRWSYTATTRGIETVFAINAPNFLNISKLKVGILGTIGTLPKESMYLDNVAISPFHKTHHHRAKSLKYWEISEKLVDTDFTIIGVESFDYLERYEISDGAQKFKIEASHKGSGHFVDQFKVVSLEMNEQSKNTIEKIFNGRIGLNINPQYYPSKDFLDVLFTNMQSKCAELDILITNVLESEYHVTYYLITDSICSYIQFYFDKKGMFSTAMPKSYQNPNDQKLIQLIQKLENDVV